MARLLVVLCACLQCVVLTYCCRETAVESRDNFLVFPTDIVEDEGDRVVINCEYYPSNNPAVWTFDGSGSCSFLFGNNSAGGFYNVPGNGLVLYPLTTARVGNYYCLVGSEYSQPVAVRIFYMATITNKDKPEGVVTHNYNLLVQRTITLNLTTSGTPTPELRLEKRQNDGSFQLVTDSRIRVDLIGVHISSVQPEHDGLYRLTATQTRSDSSKPKDDTMFTITVNIPAVKPIVAILDNEENVVQSTLYVAFGTNSELTCRVTSLFLDDLSIEWVGASSSDVSMGPNEATLQIRNTQSISNRVYTCHARNSIGTTITEVTVDVGFVPVMYNLGVTQDGSTLQLSWSSSDPSSAITVTRFLIRYMRLFDNGTSGEPIINEFGSIVSAATIILPTNGRYSIQLWAANAYGSGPISEKQVGVNTGTDGINGSPSSSNNSGALIGVVAGVCFLFALMFVVVLAVLLTIYIRMRNSQAAQQQWTKDVEYHASQLSLSQQSMRTAQMNDPGPTYALPIIPVINQISTSTIIKRYSEENDWQIPRENIQLSELLAEGEHTALYRATAFGLGKFKHSVEVMVKQVKDNSSYPEEVKILIEEMDLMSDVGIHPNVVNVLAVCTVGDPVYLIMDYFPHGDLLGFLRATRGHTDHYGVYPGIENKNPGFTLQPQELLSISLQVASGMSFLEERKVSHRSLCARNVLVGSGLQVKIYNYGQKNDDQSSYAKWMAPETLFDGTANTASDVWSFGVTLWEIVTIGGSPYFEMRPEDMRKVLEDGYRMPNPEHCSEEIYKIMQDCWEYDPQDRPSFDLINYRLETLTKSKLEYLDLKLYDEVLYSQFEDTPQLCTAL